ncbi:MAG TPA: patatin-like phospholipase family protein [Gemmatimonadaceae bacterium]|nr:patatin-like phospholipase family protein [Gemmatimonadaceae bacterium]
MTARRTIRCALAFALLTLSTANGRAQSLPNDVPHPRVGLVLSGGSAKGFAQIGVLQVLEELGVPVDLVTGTSMGAIIGGLYAIGYSPQELERLALTEDWSNFFKRPTNRRYQSLADKINDQRYTLTFPLNRARPGLPSGFLPRQGIAQHIERFTWPASGDTNFFRLPTPYAALVTDLATGQPILMRSGSVAQAMEASAAVPGAFTPVRLADGRRAVDGAVVRNIPASDARSLGADILICVDVSERVAPVEKLRSLVDIVDQTVAFRVQASNVVELPLCRVVIDPDITGLPSVDFAQSKIWIARGRAAALAHRAELSAIADSLHAIRGAVTPRAAMSHIDSVFVRAVGWSTVSTGADGMVRGTLELGDDTWVSLPDIEAAVSRVYSTGRFDQVSFRLVPHNNMSDLIFDLTEGDRDVLALGIRYDTPRGVGLLASATVTDWISPGSSASVSARLGAEQQFDARDVVGEGPTAHFTQTYRVTFSRTSLPHFRELSPIESPTFDVREIAAEIGRTLSSSAAISVDVAHTWSHDGAAGADPEWALRSQSFTTLGATVRADTYDRSFAPTHGYAFLWRSEVADHDRGGDATFTRHFLSAQYAYSLISNLTFLGGVDAGYAFGADLPEHDRFLLGGSVASSVWPTEFIPFLGFEPQSQAGTAIQVAHAGVQAELPFNLVATVRGNLGNTFDAWPSSVRRSEYVGGAGITIGTMLTPGPLSITVASRSWRAMPIVEISFGAVF